MLMYVYRQQWLRDINIISNRKLFIIFFFSQKKKGHPNILTSRYSWVLREASSFAAIRFKSFWYFLQSTGWWSALHVRQFFSLQTGQSKSFTSSSYTHHPWQLGVWQWKLSGALLSAVTKLRNKYFWKSFSFKSCITKINGTCWDFQ